MHPLRSYDADDIRAAVTMSAAIDELRSCFAAAPDHIARRSHRAGDAELLIMPAAHGSAAGVKLLMLQPTNAERGLPVINGTYVLFDTASGRPIALLDGAALTTLRTPAVSAIATGVLARHDAVSLGVVGTGPQAVAHIEAMLCVRPELERIVVASRDGERARSVLDAARSRLGSTACESWSTGSVGEAAGCDIVCVATRSMSPIIDSPMIRPGTHINAIGAYQREMCELDPALIIESSIFVDELQAANEEAGDLIQAAANGWSWNSVAGDLVTLSNGANRRTDSNQITIFKSVGLAVEDLVIARLVAGI